jgi:hypothetical protein
MSSARADREPVRPETTSGRRHIEADGH